MPGSKAKAGGNPGNPPRIAERKQFSKESLRASPNADGSILNVAGKYMPEETFLSLDNIIKGRNSTNCEMMREPKRGLRNAAAAFWHLHPFARKGTLFPSNVGGVADGSEWEKFLDACHVLQETNIAIDPSFAPQMIDDFTRFLTTGVAEKEQIFRTAAQVASRAFLFSMHLLEQMAILNNREEWCAKIEPKIRPPHPWSLNPSSSSLMELYLAAAISRPLSSAATGPGQEIVDLLRLGDSGDSDEGYFHAAALPADPQGAGRKSAGSALGHLPVKVQQESNPGGSGGGGLYAGAQCAWPEGIGESPPCGQDYARPSGMRKRPERPDLSASKERRRSGRANRPAKKSLRAGRSGRRKGGRANRGGEAEESTPPTSRRRSARGLGAGCSAEASPERRVHRAAKKQAPRAQSPREGRVSAAGGRAAHAARRKSGSRETSSASGGRPRRRSRRPAAEESPGSSEGSDSNSRDLPPKAKQGGDKKYGKEAARAGATQRRGGARPSR